MIICHLNILTLYFYSVGEFSTVLHNLLIMDKYNIMFFLQNIVILLNFVKGNTSVK